MTHRSLLALRSTSTSHRIALALGLTALLAGSPAIASPGKSGESHGKKNDETKPREDESSEHQHGKKDQAKTGTTQQASEAERHDHRAPERAFGKDEAQTIRDWFSHSQNLAGLPPGLAKRESLPPGLQKQLQKNGKLPKGLQDKLQPLPIDLEHRLPRLAAGYRRYAVDRDVVLIETATNRVRDILRDVLPH